MKHKNDCVSCCDPGRAIGCHAYDFPNKRIGSRNEPLRAFESILECLRREQIHWRVRESCVNLQTGISVRIPVGQKAAHDPDPGNFFTSQVGLVIYDHIDNTPSICPP